MRRRTLFWLVVSLLCFAGAVYFWQRAEEQRRAAQNAPLPATNQAEAKPASAVKSQPARLVVTAAEAAAAKISGKTHYPWRLSNTTKTTGQLLKSGRAIHLMNALIDTSKSLNLAIPESLRAPGGNGSYIVQARGSLDNNFRAQLQNAGATIVSYVPNNAYLVRVSDAGAQQLQSVAQSVLPFEPYYKLEPSVLNAVMQDSVPPVSALKVTLFPDASPSILTALNINPTATDSSPFGPVVTVPAVTPETIVEIARLPGVQAVAPAYQRKGANDLMRPRLGVSADSLTTTSNYLGLSGKGVMVSINDSGVDSKHLDLTGRIFGDSTNALTDTDGHGTHVAGTILGNGTESSTVDIANVSGSTNGASFRGMATNANGYVITIDSASDSYLQEQPARTNALISNNSWNYANDAEYDIAAASYDAAVRDALPEVSGSQPLIFVFSAGNYGGGTDDGQNGSADSILSPATAKNVITVGAIEQPRNITNFVTEGDVTNTQPFLPSTDTDDQVASFSSRGNVGPGVEGPNGRFKPDLVSPGTFVVSCRSEQWDTNAYYNPTNEVFSYYANQSVDPGNVTTFIYPVPADAVQMVITVLTNVSSPSPFPEMPIYLALNAIPPTNIPPLGYNGVVLPTNSIALNYGDTVYFSVGNPTNTTVNFDVQVEVWETNADLAYLQGLEMLNNNMSAAPQYYRYESGTSMAAAGISGTLADMEDFFINTLKITNASPALMKALLINGARSVSSPGQPYDLQVSSAINFQGWGLPYLPNSIPPELTNYPGVNPNTLPVMFFDQSPTNALATGQSATSTLKLTGDAAAQPLRVTLVWTDPPGNPNVGIKLVNDLDLIVSNTDTGDVYYGNDIPSGSIYNEIASTNELGGTNSPADAVNNVENVFLAPSMGTNFSITVYGHHINVNAVTLNTNNVVQDYALVISSGDAGAVSQPFTSYTQAAQVVSSNNVSPVTTLLNGIPLLNQRIGANSQYAFTTNGVTNQWNFYVFTNTAFLTNANYTNVAFVTFFPPNLGVPRMEASGEIDPSETNATRSGGADVDLYVSTDPGLTNLDTNVIAQAFANGTVSVNRNGNQTVVFVNSTAPVYYIGVKSEDQEGAQYGFAGVASDIPFSQSDQNGNTVINMMPLPAVIPTGSSASPQYVLLFGVTTQSVPIRKLTVTENVTAANFGDYIGTLSHNGVYDTLNNHTYFTNGTTTETLIYDDSGEGDTPGAIKSVGPGSLQSYVGGSAVGSWIFTMVNDSSPSDNGTINTFQLTIEPQPPTNGVTRTLLGSEWFYDFIDVPENCTNLTIFVQDDSGNEAPLELFVKRGGFPTLTDYDKVTAINPPGGTISITAFDSPPLNPGRYYIGVYNPNAAAVTFTLFESLGLSVTGESPFQFLSVGDEPIPDDAVMYSTNLVGINSPVVSASVGVRIDHPRISDLVLTLISPEGTRVLLAENRGGLTTNYGSGFSTTNVLPETVNGTQLAETNQVPLTNGLTSGTLVINYNFYTVPDDMQIYYGGSKIFDSGLINGSGTFAVNFGPGSTNLQIVMNQPGTNPTTNTTDLWEYQTEVVTVGINYVLFTEDTNLTTLPIKFAVPPFGGNAASTLPVTTPIGGFEGVAATNYNLASGPVDGWSVISHTPVTVVTVPVLAYGGSNVLALHNGSIQRILSNTVAGTTYTLNFAAHGRPNLFPVSWWKGEGTAQDLIDGNGGTVADPNATNYAPGLVGQAFAFGGNANVFVSDAPNLEFTNSMTAEAWIYPTNITIGNSYSVITKYDIPGNTTGNDAYTLGIESTNGDGLMQISADGFDVTGSAITTAAIPVNQWTHIASTYDGTNLNIYFNGTLQGTVVPAPEGINPGMDGLGIGGTVGPGPAGTVGQPFQGLIDEATVYNSALTTLQVQDIYAAGSAGKVGPLDSPDVSATLNLGGLSTNISAGDGWVNYSITFVATSNNTLVQFIPGADGMLLDSFSLSQTAQSSTNGIFLPEEPLTKVTGENARGAWQLEVLDNRAGSTATNPTPMLVSWELSLFTETLTPTATPLSFGIAQSNTVPPNSIVYYVVNVPPWAQFATNLLFGVSGGGSVNLLFNQNYEPATTTNGGDYALLTNINSSGTATLSNSPPNLPQLIPGEQYYLGVQNTGALPETFDIEVYFNIPVLTNMVPVTNTLAASSVPQYYQFNVTNGVMVSYQLLNLTGNVDLVVSDGPPLPTLAASAYASSYIGASNETIIVTSNSSPVPLGPGTWYLGVYNQDVTPQQYTIMASEYGAPNIIPLSNGVPVTINFPPGPALNTFFSFTITNSPAAALFELYSLSGNVDLTLAEGQGNYPYGPPGTNYFAQSANPGTNDEQIVVRTNTALNSTVYTTNLNNIWYLGVPNNEVFNVTFTIMAEETTNGILTNGYPPNLTIQNGTNGLTFTWPTVPGQTYEIQSATNLFPPVSWTSVATNSNAPPTLETFVDTNAINGVPFMFYRLLQLPAP